MQAAFPPLWMQRLALAPLAWLAKRRGYATRYTPEPTATDERHAIERNGRHESRARSACSAAMSRTRHPPRPGTPEEESGT
jgi:hypothetical protein